MRVFAFAVLIAASSLRAAQPEQVVPPFPEVHVDERCRIFTQDRPRGDQHYSKPKFRADTSICQLNGEHHTKHWEQTVEDGVVRRTRVEVREHSFILHNGTDMPVTFVVDQSLPAGWRVDSTPQPVEVANSMATFKVVAEPGQTIRLHVGERH
ncbi:hypothetical protein SAMN05421770_10766 [Granulicella rosea]|uniref:Uncharacterized protein n=1 Tax=Granulicella rosea TaxID=474952 RepID=A0A239LJI4_9BACT|nr:hypothetical protein [Granulicella rosea]SNT30450.1 hypothetical protein SAMN05421770_10766 [Granulicella rosea]